MKVTIKDIKPFNFDELFDRLRRVELKGIRTTDGQPICVYKEAEFKIKTYQPDEIASALYTPQAKVYTERLEFFDDIVKQIKGAGHDHACALTECYDYTAAVDGEETIWSMIPPVIEELVYPVKVDFAAFTKNILPNEMELLPETDELRVDAVLPTICDGDHRIYYALKNNLPITVVQISNIKTGYPYYALPQKYRKAELATRADGELPENKIHDKIHIYPKADEKKLYRLFPSGGIHSGDVRVDAK